MKFFSILTPRHMAWIALGTAIAYAIVGFTVGGEGMSLVILGVPPLVLLSGILWLPWLPAAWAGAVLSLLIALFGFAIGPLAGSILALVGLSAFLSELPHLHHRHPSAAGC